MSRVQIALYTGPGTTPAHRLAHIVTCAVLTVRELSWCPYSHAELVIDGVCYSSSVRDGGVRSKTIDLASGHWRLVNVPDGWLDIDAALRRFEARRGWGYDWPGALRWGLPFLKQRPLAEYCFELVAHMLGLDSPEDWSPLDFITFFEHQLPTEARFG